LTTSTALHTDHYELTMLDAGLRSGIADRPATFEVFTRRLPPGRPNGVFCGFSRLLDALERFVFGPDELDWLVKRQIVSRATLDWLADYRFAGEIYSYREGELYGAESPVLTVEASFGQAVVLETLVLSILNHDSAIAAAAEQIVMAAGGRPVIEMGGRRTDDEAAVASARAAWIAGFASTSNLEAGRRYGLPTAGTAAHAFVLAYPDERAAFAAQVKAFGPDTTLLVDTYDTEAGVRHAIEVAGPRLAAVRIDSGDLAKEARRARALLDELGAPSTRIVASGDLDRAGLLALADAPIDGYGVGTALVTGDGAPTAGFIYKLVAIADQSDSAAHQRPVAKLSPGKATVGGRKWAWRLLKDGRATADEVALDAGPPATAARPLQIAAVRGGEVVHRPTVQDVRAHYLAARAELPPGAPLTQTTRGEPV
jgi:nicotinate phosphoribosyltransferase